MGLNPALLLLIIIVCAGIAAAITNSKNRGVGAGLLLGGLLGVIGILIAACLPSQLPKAPSGMAAVRCPRCNTVQNIPIGEPRYDCWQCHTSQFAPGVDPEDAEYVALANSAAAQGNTVTRRVRCFHCQTVQNVPDRPTFMCSECGKTLKRVSR